MKIFSKIDRIILACHLNIFSHYPFSEYFFVLLLLERKLNFMRLKNILPLVVVLFLITLAACDGLSRKQQALTEKIQYDVPVVSDNPQLDWWINNIEGSKREPFLKRMMEAADKGEVRVYDYFNNALTPAQIPAIINDTIFTTLLRDYSPYEEYDTMLIESISYRDIVKIRFMEEWSWNPGSLEMKKKILALGPVVQKKIAGENFNQLLFWISLDEDYPAK